MRKYVVTVIQISYFLIISVALLRAMQFHVESSDNMDLARHFIMMDLVKKSEFSLIEYVFLHGDAFTSNITMRFCYAFNFIIYITSKYCSNYYIMAWIFVVVDYCIIAYIGVDWRKQHKGYKSPHFFYEVLLCFSLLPFFQTVSGLRTAMAACLTALAIYLYLFKKKSIRVFMIIILLAATFHPSFLLAVPFVMVTKMFNRKTGLIVSIAGSILIPLTARILIKYSNGFFYSIAYKYLQYTGDGAYRSTRFCYYGVIIICLLTIVQHFIAFPYCRKKALRIKSNSKDRDRVEIYDFMIYYMIFILSNIGNYEMILRPAYLLGAMAPVLTGMVFDRRCKSYQRNALAKIIRMILFVIILYVSIKYLMWHSEYFIVGSPFNIV